MVFHRRTASSTLSQLFGVAFQELDVGTNHTQWLNQAGSTGLAGNRQLLSFTNSGRESDVEATQPTADLCYFVSFAAQLRQLVG